MVLKQEIIIKQLKDAANFAIHSPIVWIIYFGYLFSLYFDWLCVGSAGNKVFTELSVAKEFSWRLIWGLTSISTLLICTISMVFSLKSIHQNVPLIKIPQQDSAFIYLLIALVLFVGVILVENAGLGGDTVSKYLYAAGDKKHVALRQIIPITMQTAFSAVLLISISSSMMLLNDARVSLDTLKLKLEQYRSSFYVTSIFLCIGIINVYCMWVWAINVTSITDASIQMTVGYTLSSSIIFSIAFMMLFVPVSLAMRKLLKQKAAMVISVDNEEQYSEWKTNNGLHNTPYKHLVDGLVLLAPMFVSAATNILSHFETILGK